MNEATIRKYVRDQEKEDIAPVANSKYINSDFFDPVLVMYDIRGKQDFIYRTTKIKEIVGGSMIIRDCFDDYLYPAADEVKAELLSGENESEAEVPSSNTPGIYRYDFDYANNEKKKTAPDSFSYADFQRRVQNEGYLGELIYDGGGDYLILFKNREIQREVTERFTKKVIENTGTLRVLCTVTGNLDPMHYRRRSGQEPPGDYERLYQKHRYDENQITAPEPYASLPIVQADYLSARPLTTPGSYETDGRKVSSESRAKYRKYREYSDKIKQTDEQKYRYSEKILDEIVRETKGDSSLIAVIYIDGNNMGAKKQQCFHDHTSYDDCITALRRFSYDVQKIFIEDRLKELKIKNRIIVDAGDEITIICRADEAYGFAKAYLESLPKGYSSCAGISVFHSHTPFSDAYRIAEECCETGKIFMRENRIGRENCFMDFEFCQGAIGVSLEDIRKRNEDEKIMSRPWFVCGEAEELPSGVYTVEDVEEMRKRLDALGRSNVKGLLDPAMEDEVDFRLEIERIAAHMPKGKRPEESSDMISWFVSRRRLAADLVRVYDINFGTFNDMEGTEAREAQQ